MNKPLPRSSWPTFLGLRWRLALLLLLPATIALSQDRPPIREIFVPFDELHVILENDTQRVFLTREEYEALAAKAHSNPVKHSPHATALVAAEYQGQLEDGRATIQGAIQIEILDDGLRAIPLDMTGVGVRSALLDGKPAALGRSPQGQPILFVSGRGIHKLALSLTTPVPASAAAQTMSLTLPATATSQLLLSVPGNVEVKSGAAVMERTYDAAANKTQLELLPHRGPMVVVMSLNNRTLKDQRVVIAKSVLVNEVTQGYERIHATVSHRVLHGAVDKFRFTLPSGFEVTEIASPLVSRWEVKKDGEARTLEVFLREPTTENVVLQITATRSPPILEKWSLPRLIPLDVAGQAAVIGLLVEDRLQTQRLAPEGLIPIDSEVLRPAIPDSVFRVDPGAPNVRQIVSYFAPGEKYGLTAEFVKPPAEINIVSSLLLTLSDKQQRASGTFVITPEAENLFDFRFTSPPGWKVTQVAKADGSALAVERFENEKTGDRLHVKLPGGVKAGQSLAIRFQAVATPEGWLGGWNSHSVAFPPFTVDGATNENGLIGVAVEDDLTVRPDKLTALSPLLDDERKRLSGGNTALALAYRFDARPFSAALVVERTTPSLTAQLFSFFTLDNDNLHARYELHFKVRDAGTREVVFSLPKTTPAELAIRGLGDLQVKEYNATDDGDRRRWKVQLAERQGGELRLVVDFQQPYDAQQPQSLPIARAEGVEHQAGLVGVAGNAELEVDLETTLRTVDVGELYGADSAGEFETQGRLVGVFNYIGDAAKVTVKVVRREQYAIPSAIVQRAELVTRVSVAGRSQSVARYDLKTKAPLLEVQLPENSTLWTIFLDGQPTKPQKQGGSLLVSLPGQSAVQSRQLQIVYETPSAALAFGGGIHEAAPKLLVHAAGPPAAREIPQADLVWKLILPTGYQVKRSDGTVFGDLEPRDPAALQLARWLYELGQASPFANEKRASHAGAKSPAKYATTAGTAAKSSDSDLALDMAMPSDESRLFGAADSKADRADAEAFKKTTEPAAEKPPEMPQSALEKKMEEKSAAGDPLGDRPQPQLPPAAAPAAPPQIAPPAPANNDDLPAINNAEAAETRNKARRQAAAAFAQSQHWAEQGLSTLCIDLQPDGAAPTATFRSLGVDPVLQVSVVDVRRLHWAGWGLALLILLVGARLRNQPVRVKAALIVALLLIGAVPLLATSWLDDVALVFDCIFFAAAALLPLYLAIALLKSLGGWVSACASAWLIHSAPPVTAAGLLVAACLLLGGDCVQAQLPIEVKNLKDLIPLFDVGGPVKIPQDAVIIPYDADKDDGLKNAQKVLVPYAKYVELWNLANPDKKLQTAPPPVEYALAGADYRAALTEGDDLLVTGVLEIDVFVDKPITIPLSLVGGVLVRAALDGQPARLQTVMLAPLPEPVQKQQAQAPPNQPVNSAVAPEAVALLHLAGQGHKKLELSIRLGLERRGGWRIAHGRLPSAPATALTLTIPAEKTELRLAGVPDKASFETTKAGETIATALGVDGAFALQWRPQVAEGVVDRNLTAQSVAVLDVRDDALRLVWQVKLDFARSSRDLFKLTVPDGYLVEQITGENIRGWQTKKENGRQTVDVTLLKAALGTQTLTLHLSRRGVAGQGALAQFPAPDVQVDGAALHQGELMIRRSPRLDLRSITAAGLSRADEDQNTQALAQQSDAAEAAVLVVRPYQTYRFVKEGFVLQLAAAELPVANAALVRATVGISERETTLEANVRFRVNGQPLYRIQIALPDEFELKHVWPDDVEWAVTAEPATPGKTTKLLSVQLPRGMTSEFSLTLAGKLRPRKDARLFVVPHLEVRDVQRQDGEWVFITDRDLDLEAAELKNCEAAAEIERFGWLQAQQRELAKFALKYSSPNYAATLRVVPRQPDVKVTTLTNVKVTPQAIEESFFFQFRIARAGVKEFRVWLPEALKKSRLPSDLVSKVERLIVEPAIGADGRPVAGWVQFRFILPEHQENIVNLGLEHDRLLAAKEQIVVTPQVLTGAVERQFVVVENAGRDEVVIQSSTGLEAIDEGQQVYDDLRHFVSDGARITQAFVVAGAAPRLAFEVKTNERVETAGATISLADTRLVVDAAGAYRGTASFRVVNETMQYLEIQLPSGAALWTTLVAGAPVKPVELSPPAPGQVRIPLVKSPLGTGAYMVEIKYGGQLSRPRSLAKMTFPLVQTLNIRVEDSRVKLSLPPAFDWFDFGGTAQKVSEQDWLASLKQYYSKQLEENFRCLSDVDVNTRIRAANNLKQLQLDLGRFGYSSEFSTALGRNSQKVVDNDQELTAAGQEVDNRSKLNELWRGQEVKRTKNVANNLKSSFENERQSVVADGREKASGKGNAFNEAYFEQNMLGNPASNSGKPGGKDGKPMAPGEGDKQGDDKGKEQSPNYVPSRVAYSKGMKPSAAQPQAGKGKLSAGADKSPQPQGDSQAPNGPPMDSDGAELGVELKDFSDQADRKRENPQGNDNGSANGRAPKGEAAQQNANFRNYQRQLGEQQKQSLRQSASQPAQINELQEEGGIEIRQSNVPPPGLGNMAGMGGMGGGFGGINGPIGAMPGGAPPQGGTIAAGGQVISPAAPPPTGLASIDVEIPDSGVAYYFTTPRGDVQLTARPLDRALENRLYGAAWLLVALAAFYLATRPAVVRLLNLLVAMLAFDILLALLGLASLILNVLPLFGLLVLVVGAFRLLRRLPLRRPALQPL